MNLQRLFIVFLAIAGCHQIIPQNSIHSMKHGKFKDQLPFEQQKIIDQHFSTFKTTGQAFEHGDQGLGNRIGTYSAKSKVDKISGPVTPPVIPAVATITFTDTITMTNGGFAAPGGTAPVVAISDVTISAAGTISIATAATGESIIDTVNAMANEVDINGNLIITGKLILVGTDLIISGNLEVNGDAIGEYINIDSGSTLKIDGNIIFNGNDISHIINNGTVETINAGTISIEKNHNNLGTAVDNDGGIIKSSTGNITFDANTTSSGFGINNDNGSTIESVDGNILFSNNDAYYVLMNGTTSTNSIKTTGSGNISFINNTSFARTISIVNPIETSGTGSILFERNESTLGYESVSVESELKTTGTAGSITFKNNTGDKQSAIFINSSGVISSASTITFENNCTSNEHEVGNQGFISAVGAITLTNDSLYNNSGSGGTIEADGGAITGTAISGVTETLPLQDGDVTFTEDIVIDSNNNFTIPAATALDSNALAGVVIKAGGTITDNLGDSRIVKESNNPFCFADKVSIAAQVTIEGSLKLEGTAYLYIQGSLVINGIGSETFSLDIGADATLEVLNGITVDGKNSKSFINAGTIKSNKGTGTITIKDHVSSTTHAVSLSGANALIDSLVKNIIFEGNISSANNMDGVRIDNAAGKVETDSGSIIFKDNSSTGGTPGFGVNNFGTISTNGALQTCGLLPTGTNGGTATGSDSRDIQNQAGATISYDSWVDCT